MKPLAPALPAIIADAYRVFGGYSLGGSVVACLCPVCMPKEVHDELIRTPLRQVSSAALAEYTSSAHGWDDDKIASDMRYFLPRYLELIAADDAPDHMGMDICLRRLAGANWRASWPKAEAEVLERFFDALLLDFCGRLHLVEWPVGWLLADEVKDVLTCALTAGADVERLLIAWRGAPDPGAALHMAQARRNVSFKHGEWRLTSAYFEEMPKIEARIGAFVMDQEITARIERAFFAVEDPRFQKLLSDALFA
jgi:hypothetical protein